MIEKGYVKEIIHNYFPDLANTKFNFNNTQNHSFTEQSLVPFLIYQNTIDIHHRLICLYLPEGYSVINMIPFYVMMGQYRKALDNVMQSQNFKNQSYGPNQKQLTLSGEICTISSVDFISRQLTFRSGRGQVYHMPFAETYKVKWLKNSQDIL